MNRQGAHRPAKHGDSFRRVGAGPFGALVWLSACLVAGCATPPNPHMEQRGGLPPDCWTEVRNYQTDGNDWDWPSRTSIDHVVVTKPEAVTLSPNGAYYFALTEEFPRQSVLIFAEKESLLRISFVDPKGLADVKWINERLLYMRVWWGRIAATDFVFDVEKERVVLTESTHDGGFRMQQYQEMCPRLGGCQCIPKVPQ